jgi:ribosomal protein S21
MARKKALVRVDLRDMSSHASREEMDRAFKYMLTLFKRQVNEAGILSLYKEKQFYETPSQKKKRKRKEALLESRKEKIRDHFGK